MASNLSSGKSAIKSNIVINPVTGKPMTTTGTGGFNGTIPFTRVSWINTVSVVEAFDIGVKTFPNKILSYTSAGTPYLASQVLPTCKVDDYTGSSKIVYTTPEEVKFNLPPHSMSLPLRQTDTNTGTNAGIPATHDTRRAIMWFYGSADTQKKTGVISTSGAQDLSPTGAVKDSGGKVLGTVEYKTTKDDTNWGFQFLWNPESITTTMTRNSSVIPSNLDQFAVLNGLFTAMEAMQFTITIDRVNDFACAKAFYSNGGANFERFYQNGYPGDTSETFDVKFKELMHRGTLSDIEYIYRTINGSGQGGKKWLNGLGQETAELGFLSPTAIAIRFGPNPDSLSYIGWVETISVNHNRFTEDMIPIHSDVTIQFNAFSRVSLSSTGVRNG
jgi:hypothetical protein